MKNITILGSTGSVGEQTLQIVRDNKDLAVKAMAAGSNIILLEQQIREFKPELVCVFNEEKAKELKIKVSDLQIKIVSGIDGLIEAATYKPSQVVVTAVVGMIGIKPTIEAIKAGKDIALANKETLVTAGHIIMPLAKEYGVSILPVDSEHSAIFQSLKNENEKLISKIILTASGGPFRGKTIEELKNIQVEDALKHPNWVMGRKITIDSATMVNKGLEVIEAKWLFNVNYDNIEVVVHPQSIIHSMVEFIDSSIIAQLGMPDMRLPIQYALFYPTRRILNTEKADFFKIKNLSFEEPDRKVFKGLELAFKSGRLGGNMPTIYNASNELCVDKFLNRKISFLDIPEFIENSMSNIKYIKNPSLNEILETEKETYEFIESRC